ncbi:MAG: hypothetical protein JJT76_03430 [Clostridiaceae bacterium]|nr:hypothetical protein [Clostridiaceae bacterium]
MLKRTIKKSLSILIVFSILLVAGSTIVVNAQEEVQDKSGEATTYYLPDEIIEENFQNQIDEHLQSIISIQDRSYYSTETVETVNGKTSYGYAGGQPRDGYNFPHGGSFAWKDSSSPSVSVSVSVGGEFVNFSVGLGLASASGVGHVNVNTPGSGWFKLKVAREYQVREINIYKHHSNGTKELWEVIRPHEVTGVSFDFEETR